MKDGEVIGTRILNANQSDFGGSIPKWVVQSSLPQALFDFVEDLVKYMRTGVSIK
jgi:hypothetical protein